VPAGDDEITVLHGPNLVFATDVSRHLVNVRQKRMATAYLRSAIAKGLIE
jgi:hypothetical protein